MTNVCKQIVKILASVTGEEFFFSPLDDSQLTKSDCAPCTFSTRSVRNTRHNAKDSSPIRGLVTNSRTNKQAQQEVRDRFF